VIELVVSKRVKKAKYMKLKGLRLGQTNPKSYPRKIAGVTIPPYHYVKGGKKFKVSRSRDKSIKAEFVRKRKYGSWRGDVAGSLI
jgi:hypothetical protein